MMDVNGRIKDSLITMFDFIHEYGAIQYEITQAGVK